MPKIAVDAMGGDRAPEVVIEGALLARQELGVEILLVGPPEVLTAELAKHPGAPPMTIAPASQVVPMHEAPSAALRKKTAESESGAGAARPAGLRLVASDASNGSPQADQRELVSGFAVEQAGQALMATRPPRRRLARYALIA